eukprot:TRINITY_DN2041_c0_g1_i2.p1 TRINITY_DN2041_c0_g1~~TRINITY_DN2041_c0_g1_i2.p1  ORF type:complete len:197 (-),score=34.16 TRINITY_DN2041_c0_g1_i2:198-788(-)
MKTTHRLSLSRSNSPVKFELSPPPRRVRLDDTGDYVVVGGLDSPMKAYHHAGSPPVISEENSSAEGRRTPWLRRLVILMLVVVCAVTFLQFVKLRSGGAAGKKSVEKEPVVFIADEFPSCSIDNGVHYIVNVPEGFQCVARADDPLASGSRVFERTAQLTVLPSDADGLNPFQVKFFPVFDAGFCKGDAAEDLAVC